MGYNPEHGMPENYFPENYIPGNASSNPDPTPVDPPEEPTGTTIDQIVARIKRRLSRKNSATIDEDILDELAFTQEEFEGKPTLPWFLVETETFSLNENIGTFDLDELDASFIRFHDDTSLQWKAYPDATEENQWAPVRKYNTYEELRQAHFANAWEGTADAPRGWAHVGRTLYIRPIPSATIEFKARFYARDVVPALGNRTKWSIHCPSLLLAYTGFEMAQYLRDANAMQYFGAKYQQAHRDYLRRLTAEEMAGLSAARGDD